MTKALIVFLTLNLTAIFSGCGYKPTSHYAKHEISGKVYVKLKVGINNTTNSVLAKEFINKMIVHQLDSSLTNEISKADTIIDILLDSPSFVSLQSDNGFTTLYRTTIHINLTYKNIKTKISKSLIVSGSADYSVHDDSSITDSNKLESVEIASLKALNEISSTMAIQSTLQSFKK